MKYHHSLPCPRISGGGCKLLVVTFPWIHFITITFSRGSAYHLITWSYGKRSCPILTVFLEWLYGHSAINTRGFLLLLAGFVVKCDPVMPVISWSKTAMKTVGCVCSGPPEVPTITFKNSMGRNFQLAMSQSKWAHTGRASVAYCSSTQSWTDWSRDCSFPSDTLQDETVGPRGAAGRSYSLWDEEEFLESLSFAWARNGMTLKSSAEGSVGWFQGWDWLFENTKTQV